MINLLWNRKGIFLFTILLVCLVMGYILSSGIATDGDVQVSREITDSAYAGDTITVDVHIHPYVTNIRGFVYTENVPPGWIISNTTVEGLTNPAQVTFDEESVGYLYPNMKPYAWVFEKPPTYAENNPLSGDVAITYSLEVPASAAGGYSVKGFAMWNLSFLQDPISSTITITSVGPTTIVGYYRSWLSTGDPNVVETQELLKAADDWSTDVVPIGFTVPITTQELLQLAEDWAAS